MVYLYSGMWVKISEIWEISVKMSKSQGYTSIWLNIESSIRQGKKVNRNLHCIIVFM